MLDVVLLGRRKLPSWRPLHRDLPSRHKSLIQGAIIRARGAARHLAGFGMRKDEYYGRKSLSLQFYDILTDMDQSIRGDVAFYARGLNFNDTVLDIGCGTGRVSLGLVQLGFQVVGVDLAATMIEQARIKQRSLPPQTAAKAQFIVSDMLELDLPVRFPRIIIPFYTFNLLPSRVKRAKALKVAARHLAPGGKLIIHAIPIERLQMKKPPKADDTADITVNFENGTRLEVLWGDRLIDSARQTTRQKVIYRHREEAGNLIDETLEDLNFSWITPKEVDVSSRNAGLKLTEVRTGFVDGEEAKEQIYIFEHLAG